MARIFYITKAEIPSRYAHSVHMVKMANAIACNGHEVVLIAPQIRDAHLDIFSYYGIEKKFSIRRLPRMLPALRLPDFEILSVLFALFFRGSIIFTRYVDIAFLGAFLGKRVIYETHSPIKSMGSWRGWLAKQLLKKTASRVKVVVISQALASILQGETDINADRLIVAHDGADLVPGASPASTPIKNVGYAGHLYPGRGIEVILGLAARFTDLDFHIFGGHESDISYWTSKSQLSNLKFHGHVPHKDVVSHLQNMDVLLAPYQAVVKEAAGKDTSKFMSPLKIFEYMAVARPLIVSRLPVLAEVLRENENCLMARADDIDEWATALSRLVSDPQLAKSLSLSAVEVLRRNYTWIARAKMITDESTF